MFENLGYHFSNLEELLEFVSWLTTNFEKPDDFEVYLLERMPYLEDANDSFITITSVDCAALIDDYEGEKMDYSMSSEAEFWDIINNEYHQEDNDDTTIPGSD